MSGWIKIHRKFLDWEWFNKSEAVHLFMYMLLKANHKDAKWQGIELKRGEFISSLGNISNATGISVQSIRTVLKKLEKTNEIKIKSTNQYTIVTICKYDSYQDEKELSNKPITNNQQATNKQSTTNKKEKKEKNEKELILDAWIEYRKSIKKAISDQTINTILNKMENYTNEQCIFVINKSIENGWQGLFWDKIETIQQINEPNKWKAPWN
jgi:DNA-binding IscR family transcriptional regulator